MIGGAGNFQKAVLVGFREGSCIQALLSESSLPLCSWHAKEKGHY